MPIGTSRSVAAPRGPLGYANRAKGSNGVTGKSHFHHAPTFGGDVAKGVLNNAASVSGQLTITVLNGAQDEYFRPETDQGSYGTFTVDRLGNWTYTVATANPTVSGLATGATLTDTFVVKSKYDYRDMGFVSVVITITGH